MKLFKESIPEFSTKIAKSPKIFAKLLRASENLETPQIAKFKKAARKVRRVRDNLNRK